MNETVIPDDVQKFIIDHINSITHIEGLLLFRAAPDVRWAAISIAQRLYITERDAAQLLGHLKAQGFIEEEAGKGYSYRPKSEELRGMVERVAGVYGQYLLPVTHLIHEKSQNQVQGFADAFLIRKDKE